MEREDKENVALTAVETLFLMENALNVVQYINNNGECMKHLGKCPWCGNEVRAIVEEENYIRRDSCRCPDCGGKILICRTPGCTNYAKGGFWDDECCPECTKMVVTTAGLGAVGILVSKAFEDRR